MPLIAGRYRLGETLGVGGMGKVWQARDEVLERDVAIKEVLLPDDLAASDRAAAHRRTLREARAAARLGHPNVVQVYDVLDVDGRPWIVMAYIPSRSLHEVLKASGPLDPRRVARIGLSLVAALKAAHAAGVDHRDVKPANVLLADDGRVLLTDFGIATIEGDSQISSSDMLIGSPEFMSPERARDGTAGLASDLWSLGATLYAAVEGRSPFRRTSALATLTALAADEPDPPTQAGPLEPVLEGLLRKNPADRIGAAEAEHLLRQAASGAYGHALVPVRTDPTEALPAAEPPTGPAPAASPAAAPAASPIAAPAGPETAEATPAASPVTTGSTGSPIAEAAPAVPSAVTSGAANSAARTSRAAPPVPVPGPVSSAASASSVESAPAAEAAPSVGPAVVADVEPPLASDPGRPVIPAQRSAPDDETSPEARGRAIPATPATGDQPTARPTRRWLVAAPAVVALIGGAIFWGATRSGSDDQPDIGAKAPVASAPGPQPSAVAASLPDAVQPTSPTAPASVAPSKTTPPPQDDSGAGSGSGSSIPKLPTGWRDYRDRTGFAVYVPQGWTYSRDKTMVYFRDGSTGRVLGIDQTNKPIANPVADWQGKSEYRVGRGDFPAYREIHIRETDYFRKAADWEFTFTRNGTRQHVNNRGVITSDKQAYGFYWQTRDADWQRYRPDLQLVFDSFRPAS